VRAALIASGLALPAHRITINLADIKGQESAKRALEIAAAGGHNLLMVGPPSAGKSMLAARLPSILPPLAPSELLEVSMVASVAGEGGALTGDLFARRIIPPACPLWRRRLACAAGRGVACPSRRFVSRRAAGIPAAGARFAAPAAETGEVSIARANHRVTYPARFMLVAAMNPCRCGKVSEPGFASRRGPNTCCAAYQARISGPLIDSIDLHIEVPAVTAPPPAESSREVGARVALARERQIARYAAIGPSHIRSNAVVSGAMLEDVARPDGGGPIARSGRCDAALGYHRVLRVDRTLADLEVGRVHVVEALSYRALTDEIRRAA
jgi:magnesium chelatase family protein